MSVGDAALGIPQNGQILTNGMPPSTVPCWRYWLFGDTMGKSHLSFISGLSYRVYI